jgi:drug/metabolite transporter (DMT)-like permease
MSTDSTSTLVAQPASTLSAPEHARPNRIGVIFAFLAIWIVWGSTYLAIRYAVATIPPLYTAGMRHLTAGLILLAWCAWKKLRPTWPQIRASIVIGALFFLIGHGSLHWAEQVVPSGLASLLITTEPMFVFAITCAVEKRWRMNVTLLAGILLGVAGVALLVGRSVLSSNPKMFLGTVAILVGSLSWSAGMVYSRRSHLSGHPMLLSALSLLAGAVMLLTVGTLTGEARGFSLSSVSHRSWAALAYLIIFGSVITFSAYNWLLEHYSPTLIATHTYVNPIVAVLLGWLIAREPITLNLGIAAAMVVGAVILVDHGMARLRTAVGQSKLVE